LTLWKSPILINETGEGASEQTLHLFSESARDSGKGDCTPLKKTPTPLGKPSTSSGKKLVAKDKKGVLLLPLSLFQISGLSAYGFVLRFFRI
jgi:hypothetical protein